MLIRFKADRVSATLSAVPEVKPKEYKRMSAIGKEVSKGQHSGEGVMGGRSNYDGAPDGAPPGGCSNWSSRTSEKVGSEGERDLLRKWGAMFVRILFNSP